MKWPEENNNNIPKEIYSFNDKYFREVDNVGGIEETLAVCSQYNEGELISEKQGDCPSKDNESLETLISDREMNKVETSPFVGDELDSRPRLYFNTNSFVNGNEKVDEI